MGASESTSRLNATNEDEKNESQPGNNSSNGSSSSIETAATIATAAVIGVGAVAWGISQMLSNNPNNQQQEEQRHGMPELSLRSSPRLIAAGGSVERSKWCPPPQGRFKMNTDGACHPGPGNILSNDGVLRGPSGYGGILRDHRGKFVQGFMGFIGDKSDSLTAEFHGILKGLELLDTLNLKGAILETDSQAAYEWVTRLCDNRGRSLIVRECWNIIMDCRELVEKNGIIISLIQGEDANRCADKLAGMAIKRKEKYVEIKNLPYELKSFVEEDAKFNY